MPDNQPRIRAERHHWRTNPMPDVLERIRLDLTLTPLEYEQVCYGIIPQEIEDSWFVFMERNWLYFYDCFTGHFACSIRFAREDDQYGAAEAWLNAGWIGSEQPSEPLIAFLLHSLYKHLLDNDELSRYWYGQYRTMVMLQRPR